MGIKESDIPELIRAGRDQEVIPVLYKKVLPNVERYITKNYGKSEDAYDVFQEALLLFYKQVIKNTFNPKYKVYGYIYRLSINTWINKIKKEKRISLTDDIFQYDNPEPEDISEQLLTKNKENILEKFFSGIGDKCIKILTYSIYYNLPLEDIKLKMDFPSESAVKMQLNRCKKKLIKELENNPKLLKKLKEGDE